MKLRNALTILAAIAAGTLSACGGQGQSPAATIAPPVAQSLDTMRVLAQARQSSDTSAPYGVNGGAVTLTDTADTTNSVPINGT